MEAKKISCEKILEISSSEPKRKNEKITCECEKIIARGGISRHKKTELHKLLMEKLEEKKQREIEFVKEKLEDQIIRLKRESEIKHKSKKKKEKLKKEILEIEEKIKILTL